MSNVVRRSFVAALVVTVLGALPALAAASSIESEIELLRSDLKAGKVEIVKEAMHIEGARADAFWPVYRKYQLELDAIGDKRVALIKEYAASYDLDDRRQGEVAGQAGAGSTVRADQPARRSTTGTSRRSWAPSTPPSWSRSSISSWPPSISSLPPRCR